MNISDNDEEKVDIEFSPYIVMLYLCFIIAIMGWLAYENAVTIDTLVQQNGQLQAQVLECDADDD